MSFMTGFQCVLRRIAQPACILGACFLLASCAVPVTNTQPAPTDQRELTREVQTMLAAKGFDPGPVDGVAGGKTNAALAEFQQTRGLPRTGGKNRDRPRFL